jgi:nitroimidazol reductase NimA-like FMN-containing flavoprotein (pyridoxamine 5'-phosphate oxidase superfamily)
MTTKSKDEAELDQVRTLLAGQRLAALATEQDGRPYANIVAYANTDDLRYVCFMTTRPTQKYRNLTSNEQVALLFDSRSNTDADFHQAVAVTALGQASDISGTPDYQEMLDLFLAKHPYLMEFAGAPSTALLRVAVHKYVLVDHFQHVVEILMTR